ncbi:MAG: hypothetical protein HQ592_13510 [Planctomycetes bacterium]|nr:hypothetical protein [Planctomycetota bacterium]
MSKESSVAVKIIKSMAVVVLFGVFLKFGGFLLTVIIGGLYPPGVSPAADAYALVYKKIVYAFVYSSAARLLMPVLVPLFIEKVKQDGEAKAWEFAYSIINIVLIGIIVASGIGIIYAQSIIDLLAPGFTAQERAVSTDLLRIMLPGCVGMVLSMVMMSVLHSYKIFSYSAAGDAVQKLLWAAALFLGITLLGRDVRIVGYGFLAGCIVQVLINAFGLRNKRRFYRPLISNPHYSRVLKELALLAAFGAAFCACLLFSSEIVETVCRLLGVSADTDVWTKIFIFTSGLLLACGYSAVLWVRTRNKNSTAARLAALVAPLIIGVVFAGYRDVITSFFQSFTQSGVFADLEFSRTIGNLPIVLVAYALSVAMFPYLCDLASGKDMKTFAALVTRSLRMIAIFFIPLSIAMFLLGSPIVALIFDRGNWTNLHIGYAGTALQFYVFAMFFYAIENVIMQSYFSIQRMWKPTILGIVAAILHVAFLFIGIRALGYDRPYDIFVAVAIAFPLSRIFKNVALLAILRLHVPILPLRQTAVFAVKLLVVCAVFAVVVQGSHRVVRSAVRAEKFKKPNVVLDTFNAENTAWTSRDADEINVMQSDAGPALAFTYRPLKSRDIAIDRELGNFRLDAIDQVSFICRSEARQDVILEIAFDEETWRSQPVSIGPEWPEAAYTVDVPAGKGKARSVSLVIPRQVGEGGSFDFLRAREDVDGTTLRLREVRFRNAGREVLTDSFPQPSPEWSSADGPLRVANTGENDASEQALLLVDGGVAKRVSRGLAGYDLQHVDGLRVKVKSTVAGQLHMSIIDSTGGRCDKALAIQPSETRKTHSAAFAEFTGSLGPSLLERVQFSFEPADDAATDATVWLDNVTLTSSAGIVCRVNLRYEIAKLVNVAAPCLLGGIVLIALIFLLRIEEGRLALDWILEQARRRLRKGGKQSSAE